MLFEEGFTQNRELSWLRYNERVLEEALDETVPLFERLRFIAIFVSNLEEFFKVRVGSLLGEDDEGEGSIDEKSGLTAGEQLGRIYDLVPGLLMKKDMAYSIVEKKLADAGLVRLEPAQLNDEDRGRCFDFFRNAVKEKLTVRVLDIEDPLPAIDEERPYMFSVLDAELEDKIGFVDIPSDLPKFLMLPVRKRKHTGENVFRYVLTEDIIGMFSDTLFIPFVPLESYIVDIARNAEAACGKGTANTAAGMREALKRRRTSPADKLISDRYLGERLREYFVRNLDLDERQIFTSTRIDFSYIDELEKNLPPEFTEKLTYRPQIPYDQTSGSSSEEEVRFAKAGRSFIRSGECIIDAAKNRDLLSAYPEDSMDLFLGLLREASFSPEVSEIRITVYRLASHPKITDYLIYAARNGKKVRVVLELRARFDEQSNLEWAEKLSAAGCRVYCGTDRYKVHSKMCQIVLEAPGRPESEADQDTSGKHKGCRNSKRYITQISTGNYNEKTAKQYTDLSLITYDQEIGKAASRLFKDICKDRIIADQIRNDKSDPALSLNEAAGSSGRYAPLMVSPVNMRAGLLNLIKREADKGSNGRIFFKINSLADEEIMEALMEASCTGCRVRMIIRGICCMLPGIEGCTENVCIVNKVGRFLEHSRVYIFGSGDDELMYISSADLMKRNLDRRVETACPVYDERIKSRIRRIIYDVYCDMEKGRVMMPDGSYSNKLL